jgi:glutathione reductase (NADPH)
MRLGIEGEQHLATSEQFLDLDQLPQRLVFVGCGYPRSVSARRRRGSDSPTCRSAVSRTLVDGDTDAILGAHLVGPHAE